MNIGSGMMYTTITIWGKRMYDLSLKMIREIRPLVLFLTNQVSINFCANILLSVGASPLMSNAQSEVEELINCCDTLVINIGTLNEKFNDLALLAINVANENALPIVFDPVGVGASKLRAQMAKKVIASAKNLIIKGNASEIMKLAGKSLSSKGVDSLENSSGAIEDAKSLLCRHENINVIIITGKEDYIVSRQRESVNNNGSYFMPLVTGTGCALAGVIAAFCSVNKNKFQAAVDAVDYYTSAAMKAEKKATGTGTFAMYLIDALYE